MNKKIIFSIIGVIIVGVAYYLVSPLWRNVRLDEPLPQAETSPQVQKSAPSQSPGAVANAPIVLKEALMVESAHSVAGKALLLQSGDQKIVRFENLKTINGPDVHIYLSAGLNADDFVDLGSIRATEGNVNYAIPAGTDTNKYHFVLIWCRAFRVLFSYASL